MKQLILILVLATAACAPPPQAAADKDVAAWEQQAQNVMITRDDLGIAHVKGKTDADAVFGAIYAQAEDDFNRVETNFINSQGRLAEAEGEPEIYRDLRMKLFVDPADMQAQYEKSPAWLKKLMDGWAAGLNYYLYKHPDVKPRVIKRFEPWMALTFSEGSIGGDIEKVNLTQLEAFYGKTPKPATQASLEIPAYVEPTGSNGAAVGASNTIGKHALLLINPHTSFFFRSELQMTSDEGLNAYGASTWGQFFIYQGFNERVGWMHTSSGVDNIDEYLETIVQKPDGYYYKYGSEERKVVAKRIVVPYKTANGTAQKEFTVYRTHHGPIVREADGKWIAVRLMEEPMKALNQSYSRTKAKNYKEYKQVMDLHTNSSNNTIYADADGTIAYFHSNFIPRRDPKFDWTKPVDGSNPATEWNGVLSIDETPGLMNPASGWLYNTNNWPWSAAGTSSPKKADFPVYVERNTENPRGIHAIKVLDGRKDFTLDSLVATAYDSYLTEFDIVLPPLFKAYDQTPATNPLKKKVSEQIAMLRGWDRRWAVSSEPTAVAGTGARKWRVRSPPMRARQACRLTTTRLRTRLPIKCYKRWPPLPISSPPTSASGRRRGATSTASSASVLISFTPPTMRSRASRWDSPRRDGDPSRRSAPGLTKGRRRFTARPATALLPSSNSAIASTHEPSPPAVKAVTWIRSTSTIRPSDTQPEISGRCISTRIN